MKKINFIITIFILTIFYVYISYIMQIPEEIVLLSNEKIEIRNLPGITKTESAQTSNGNIKNTTLELKIGDIVLKNANISVLENIQVVPVGKIIGLKLYTNGVLVVGFSEIEDYSKQKVKPYENSDIKEGDMIIEIDENEIEDIEDLKNAVNSSTGNDLKIKILRNGSVINTSIKPVEIEKREYRLGLWVRDAATGVGTVTFYEPETKAFAALGHGITDADTNKLINIDSGELVISKILSIKKGEEGSPGEIKGTIVNQKSIGEVLKNTEFGVYGILDDLTNLNIDVNDKLEVALRDEIKEGKAYVICSIDDSNVEKEYEIEIQKIYYDNNYNNKSMLIKITDEQLLEKTGGIIRGLSGAPIVQNGKFIGAITNVLVSDPAVGYAVFGDLMIKELKYIK